MITLDELDSGDGTTVDDLITESQPSSVVPNHASNKSLAAYSTLLSEPETGEQLASDFNSTLAELDQDPSIANVERILGLARTNQFNQTRDALTDFLADPNVSDKDKEAAANGVLDINTEQYDSVNSLSRNLISAESPGEDAEAENVRISLSSAIEEVNSTKRAQQALLNSQVAAGNISTGAAYADIFEFFLPLREQAFTAGVLDSLRGGEGWAVDETFTLLGNAKSGMKETLEQLPPSERLDFSEKLVALIKEQTVTTLTGENDFAEMSLLRTFLEDGYYETSDKWIDNVTSILDLLGVGTLARRGLKSGAKVVKGITGLSPESLLRNARRQSSTSRASHTSPAKIAKDTNPSSARGMHEAAASDQSDEVAEALYGTTKADAIASDLSPQVSLLGGRVEAKVSKPDLIYRNSSTRAAEVIDDYKSSGFIELTKSEKISARTRVINDFENVDGFSYRSEMQQIEEVAGGVNIKSVYGPTNGGFSSPTQALDSAKWALRDYAITDADLTLLVREGGDYVPTTINDLKAFDIIEQTVKASGKPVVRVRPKQQEDFLVQVNHEYKFNPADVTEWSKFDVSYNIFDRIGIFLGKSKQGSLQRTLVDPASSLDPAIVLSANRGFDRAAQLERGLLELGGDFANGFKKMPKGRQKLLDDLIRENNHKGEGFDYNKMVREGFTPSEINVAKGWKEYWDTAYILENSDLAKTKKAQGFKEFIDQPTDTKLLAKPVSRAQVGNSPRVYNHAEDTTELMTKQDIEELYARGGTLARMQQPLKVGDDAVEFIVSRNSPGGSYLRELTENSEVLTYRDGYYTVQYTDPQFVVKVVKNSRGEELYQKAVASAGSIGDAKNKAARLAAGELDNSEYIVRSNVKGVKNDSNMHWDLQQARGRTSQRVRGERLEDSTSNIDELSNAPIMNPVDSMISSARSIGNRVPMRSVIEAHKGRFLDQYGDYLPDGQFGNKAWTTDVTDIKYRNVGSEDGGRLADAKTTFEYINYLENGYINALDDGIKSVLKSISNIAGEHDWKAIEKGFGWASETRGPTALAKSTAFTMFLATNPVRQFIVQGHQAVQLAANFPGWIKSATAAPDMLAIVYRQMGIKVPRSVAKSTSSGEDGLEAMLTDWRRSGMSASIDKQNLIRGSLSMLADATTTSKLLSPVTAVTTGLRKVGFDSGEYINLMTSWLAHRHQAIAAGDDIADFAVLDTVSAKARNYTYNMNAAGDMPYNQNSLAILFQFMQVPHKALTTMTTNRILTKKQKLRLLGFNTLMYAPPASMLALFGDFLPSDADSRDLMVNGLEGFMLNKALSLASGEDTYLDWSGLSPMDMFGTGDFIHSLFTQDPGTIIANTPSGQLLFGGNPRITNFVKSAARYTNLVDDYSDPTTFGDVAMDFGRLSSGFSNAFKSAYAMEYGLKRSSFGGITDSNVTSAEALMQVMGLPTVTETLKRGVKTELYEKSSAYREDVTAWYKGLKKSILRDGITPEEIEYITRVHSEAFRVWGNDSVQAKKILDGLLSKDVSAGDARLYKQVLKSHGIMSADELLVMVDALGGDMTEAQKAGMKDAIKFMQEIKGE